MEIKSQHTKIEIVSRSKGQSVLAKAAYNARDKLNDEYYGRVHNYSRKDDLVFSKIFLPSHIPDKFSDREFLWNEVERVEKSKNSQLARNLIFAIPRELNEEDRIKLVTDFVEDNFVSKGMIADVNIHNSVASDGGEQPHAHILLTLREIDEKGKWKAKSKKVYVLDDNGDKIKLPSGNYKSYKEDINDWNYKENAKLWREDFSKKANDYLAKNNIDKRIDPRTFKEQGREELPQIHLGTVSYQMEQKGIKTERGNINRRIIAINNDLKNSLREIAEVGRWIGRITRAVIFAFKELSKEKEIESKFEPELFDLYTYLKTYDKMQNEIALTLDSKNKARKRNSDTKKSLHTFSYMRNNNIKTIIDFQIKKDEVNKKLSDNKAEINDINTRLKTLETYFKQAEIMSKNKKVYNKFVNMDNSFMSKLKNQSKDDFYKKHKTEIEKVRKAKSILKNLSGSERTDTKNWEKEREKLKSNLSILEFNQKEIKEEVSQLKHIIYMVDKVNDEYGIEIDVKYEQEYYKALARGEKPSPMTKVRHDQRRLLFEKEQRDRNREYYQNKAKTKGDMER